MIDLYLIDLVIKLNGDLYKLELKNGLLIKVHV